MSNLVLLHSDHELVARARRGDRHAFEQLAERHRQMCLRLSFAYMRNHADVEDQIQSSLLKAWVHLEQYNGDAAFSTWLGSIVIGECLMSLRAARRRRSVSINGMIFISPRRDPEALYARKELRRLVRFACSQIKPLHRPALIHDLKELTIPEVADELHVSIACAKSRVFRARAELRAQLERLQIFF